MTGLVIDYAFKEWAVIVEALGQGKQSLILRKGGIAEEDGAFRSQHEAFYLFPTFEHQNEGDLVPEFHETLRSLQRGRQTSRDSSVKRRSAARLGSPEPSARDSVPIQYYAIVQDSYRIDSMGILEKLKGYHAWSESSVKKKFGWGAERLLWVLLARIFRLAKVVEIPSRDTYRGCKSWVKLEETIPTEGSTPVLQDDAFQKIRAFVRRALDSGLRT